MTASPRPTAPIALLAFGALLSCGGSPPEYPSVDPDLREARLELPTTPPRVILDTDTGNEIDDQFALAYALLSPALEVVGVHSAPYAFGGELLSSPYFTSELDARFLEAEIAERFGVSPEEVPELIRPRSSVRAARDAAQEIVDLCGSDLEVQMGSQAFVDLEAEPRESEATRHLIEESFAAPLTVVAMGAITNVAEALRIDPTLALRITVVWVSAYPLTWDGPNASYNLAQDVDAFRVVLESGVPFIYVPGFRVAEELRTNLGEMQSGVAGDSPLRTELFDLYEGHGFRDDHFARSKVLWDMAAVAVLALPGSTASRVVRTPRLDEELIWAPDGDGLPMREVTDLHRDSIFADFFAVLDGYEPSSP